MRQGEVDSLVESVEARGLTITDLHARAVLASRELLEGQADEETRKIARKVLRQFNRWLRGELEGGHDCWPTFGAFMLPHAAMETEEDKAEAARIREEYLSQRAACGNGPPATD